MTEQLAKTPTGQIVSDSATSIDPWVLARKRANDYLKLHRIPEAEREQLLSRISGKLARTGLYPEQELIRLFISTAQEELALLQNQRPSTSCCQCKKTAEDDLQQGKPEVRTQTGPRFQRSSIRVAPLKAISLLPSRSRFRLQRY